LTAVADATPKRQALILSMRLIGTGSLDHREPAQRNAFPLARLAHHAACDTREDNPHWILSDESPSAFTMRPLSHFVSRALHPPAPSRPETSGRDGGLFLMTCRPAL
jgi:hypothetical protein